MSAGHAPVLRALGITFGLIALLIGGCASPCQWTTQGCLELTVEGDLTPVTSVQVELTLSGPSGPGSLRSLRVAELELPALLRVPRPEVTAGQAISALTLHALSADQTAYSSQMPLVWPAGLHLSATLRLGPVPAEAPPLDMMPDLAVMPVPARQLSPELASAAIMLDREGGGTPDLLLAYADQPGLALLRFSGDAQTVTVQPIALPVRVSGLAAGDFCHHGLQDVVAVSADPGQILAICRQAGGGFDAPLLVRPEGGVQLVSPILVDLDGDHRLDLVVLANQADGRFLVLRGVKTPDLFGLAEQKPTGGSGPTVALAGDFEGDGRPDLIIANTISGEISILLNHGGSFEQPVVLDRGDHPRALAAGLLDRDSLLDLAVAFAGPDPERGPGLLKLWRSKGDGHFDLLSPATALPPAVRDLQLPDLDGDGTLDLVSLHSADTTAVTGLLHLIRRGVGRAVTVPIYSMGLPVWAHQLTLLDVDRDGLVDAILTGGRVGPQIVFKLPTVDQR